MEEKHVVTCFLESNNEILILQRSEKVGSYRGSWAGVSGYVETSPDEQALIEIAEETGLSAGEVHLVKKGEPLEVTDEGLGIRWIVHPYLFHVEERSNIKTDWEHVESTWITPRELGKYRTVPNLEEALQRVWL